ARAALSQDGAWRRGGRIHARRRSGAGRVGRERDPRIARRRYHEFLGARQRRPGDRGGQSSRLERSRGVRAFVLDPELVETLARGDSLHFEQRRTTLAERDRGLSIAQWQPPG